MSLLDDRTQTPGHPPVLDLAAQLSCLDEVMRVCRRVADEVRPRARTSRPSSLEAVLAARAVLGADARDGCVAGDHLGRCADAVRGAGDGFVSLGPADRRLLVSTSRALHQDPFLSGQRAVLAAITAERTWGRQPDEGVPADRLETGLGLARAVIIAAWTGCREDVAVFRGVVSGRRRTSSAPDPYLHVVAATVVGSLTGALSCPADEDPYELGLALGLAAGVRQVVAAALTAERPRAGDRWVRASTRRP
ncbi:MAG: hypothetical protein Q7T56_06290 [Nocardioidaceae bacterium]|nr:hypothetical protein [Nocardioidaceae bacterium]